MKSLLYLTARPELRIVAGSVLLYALALWWLPSTAVALSAILLLATAALGVGRLLCVFAEVEVPEQGVVADGEFVSIHIATYSEPPEVVIETLESLVGLDGPDYEVIVLDNNTPDRALYEPVREHCQKLGAKFRFYHFDNVKGAKAGALNISLKLSSPKTTKLLILDADYHASRDILKKGLAHFVDSTVGLVQFPQAYRNSRPDCGLSWEYKLFFDVYMNQANRMNTVLSTGTAAFLCKDALLKSGGWSGDTLTEDAELGLRLHRNGYRGVYVPEVAAAGLMPTDVKSLKAQRRRWVLGNAQSLGGLFKEPNISWPRKAMMFLQLTAWASPLLASAVVLVTGTLMANFSSVPEARLVAGLGALSVLTYLLTTLVFCVAGVRRNGGSFSSGLHAFMTHLGMAWEGSVCPCELFVHSDKSFVRTDKFIRAPEKAALISTLALSLLCGTLGFNVLLSSGCPGCVLICTTVAIVFSGKAFLQWNVSTIRNYTVNLSKACKRPTSSSRLKKLELASNAAPQRGAVAS